MKISVPKEMNTNNVFPAGIYRFTISTTPKVDKSASSDNLLIKPEFTCMTPVGPDGSKTQGRKVWDNWTVAPQCLPIWNNAFKALTGADIPAGDFEIDEFVNMITSQVTGKECILEIGIDYQKKDAAGKWVKCGPDDPDVVQRNRIKKAMSVGGGETSAPKALVRGAARR